MPRPDDWQILFNGRDLAGWRANNDPASFAVADGCLRAQGSGPAGAHLFYVGDKAEGFERFTNFELELAARAEPESNSGIFFHTDESVRLPGKYLTRGYEVQLNTQSREPRKTGSLYAVVDLDQSPVDEGKWFAVRIAVAGKRITVALDGKTVVDYTEPAEVRRPPERKGRVISPTGGGIALQAHDPKSVWYFKDIRAKRLP